MNKELNELKTKLYKRCHEIVNERIDHAEQGICYAKDAATDDTKSSAGDKYETTREMMQQEINRNERQLAEANRLKYQLDGVSVALVSDIVQLGSLVQTNDGLFFLAIALGTVELSPYSFFVISPVSPFGQTMLGKRVGECLTFNKRSYQILAIV
ncbi:MAG: GreA/GreB family elongation factor [Olivibacter sp.]|uniref:3-oxoacyl-ACP synthase n=1 Tax=Sphingobacterium sp. (strain 21) TaxID=743722 RepID=F4C4N7_SPHS2|nr:GreA/GreB family elongation factor [Olivibacter sp. UJ_SKK_5.1]